MFDWFNSVPSEYCCLILPRIVWPMIFADVAIAISYFAIGGWLFYVSLKGSAYASIMQGARLLLGLFILLCGLGHLIDAIKIFYPLCDTMVIVRLATAAISVMTWLWAWKNKNRIAQILAVKGHFKK